MPIYVYHFLFKFGWNSYKFQLLFIHRYARGSLDVNCGPAIFLVKLTVLILSFYECLLRLPARDHTLESHGGKVDFAWIYYDVLSSSTRVIITLTRFYSRLFILLYLNRRIDDEILLLR